jgi:hypothetical protein
MENHQEEEAQGNFAAATISTSELAYRRETSGRFQTSGKAGK